MKHTVPIDELLEKYRGEKYQIIEMPAYLILHLKRFVHNNFFMEKNPTLVSFPLEGLEISGQKYDLVANITHEGEKDPKSGIYKI